LALYYLDTSALVKLYVQEPGTQGLLGLAARSSDHRFAVLDLARVELHSAIRRRQRDGDLDVRVAGQILARFDQHMETRFVRQPVNEPLVDIALTLLERHPLRAYDAVQLAGCLVLKASSGVEPPIFVCSDRQLVEVAEGEGLAVVNPAA
jgi:predicted nucleic acid-binding protein